MKSGKWYGVKDPFISKNVPTYPHLKSDELRAKFFNGFNEEKKSFVKNTIYAL